MAISPLIRIASSTAPGGLTLSTIYGLENASRATLGSLITISGLEILMKCEYGINLLQIIITLRTLLNHIQYQRQIALFKSLMMMLLTKHV